MNSTPTPHGPEWIARAEEAEWRLGFYGLSVEAEELADAADG